MGPIFVKFQAMENAWEGKPMSSLYGGTMGIRCPYVLHRNETFACSTSSMEVIWDVHIVMFHRLSIPAIKTLLQLSSYRLYISIYMESLWGKKVSVIFNSVFITQHLSKYHLLWIFYGLGNKILVARSAHN